MIEIPSNYEHFSERIFVVANYNMLNISYYCRS